MAPTVDLKEYFDARLSDLDKRIEQARLTMEKRLDGMNEFRDALKDQSGRSPTREEINAKFDAVDKAILDLQISKATLSGKASQGSFFVTLFFSVAGLVLGIYAILSR